ncbi:hypothetical protein BJ741DRAFT_639682 [Chytriomyces cf. hyalinus JEL632]|nr:hypothetical protein BJ741DRAFT_639682 [Chytriomyces cf. hyalinus JEL632]
MHVSRPSCLPCRFLERETRGRERVMGAELTSPHCPLTQLPHPSTPSSPSHSPHRHPFNTHAAAAIPSVTEGPSADAAQPTLQNALKPMSSGAKPISGFLQWVDKTHPAADSTDLAPRFLVLNGHAVHLFASSEPSDSVIDVFALTQNTVVQNALGLSLAFELSASRKKWILQANTIAAKASWLNSIKNAIKTSPAEEEADDAYDVLADYGDDEAHEPATQSVQQVQPSQSHPQDPLPYIPRRLESHKSESSPVPQSFPLGATPAFPPPSAGTQFSQFPQQPIQYQQQYQQQQQQQQQYAQSAIPPMPYPVPVNQNQFNAPQQQQQQFNNAQQPQPYNYAAFQTPPSRLNSPMTPMSPMSPMSPNNDAAYQIHRRGSNSNSVRSYGGSMADTVNTMDSEVSALRTELERAKRELNEQMRMNKALVTNQRAASSSPRGENYSSNNMSRSGSKMSSSVETASNVMADKSDGGSVKSAKSTGGGWFGRSKSQTKEKPENDIQKKKSAAIAKQEELAIMSGMSSMF